MHRSSAFVLIGLLLASCATGDVDPEAPDTPVATPTASDTPEDTAASPTPGELSGPPLRPRMVVTGPEEVVFDWSEDACDPENIPDIAARAFRGADDQVRLLIGHWDNYAMVGPTLDEVTLDCTPLLTSDFDPDPAAFNDSEWLGSVATEDGETVHAIIHNEYRGDTHGTARPGQCPSGARLTCLDTSFTLAVSRDGGVTFDHVTEPPGHLLSTLPRQFDDKGRPSGIRQPSNLVRGPDDAWYLFGNVSDYPDDPAAPFEDQWTCLLRTTDLGDPAAWRYWDGDGFNGQVVDPYVTDVTADEPRCAPVDDDLGNVMHESVVWVEPLERYVMLGIDLVGDDVSRWAIQTSFSTDLLSWSPPEPVMELAAYPGVADAETDVFHAYLSLLDPDSSDRSFSTSDDDAYVYVTRFNAGSSSLDRDLLRIPVAFEEVEVEARSWTFETDGDTEGWFALNALAPLEALDGALRTTVVGEDPYMAVTGLSADSSLWDTVVVTMAVDGGGSTSAELFFTTSTTPEGEDTRVDFPTVVRADGELHTYEIPVGVNPYWADAITGLRVDPARSGDRQVVIESIELS